MNCNRRHVDEWTDKSVYKEHFLKLLLTIQNCMTWWNE